jgi:hypothetical protein
MGGVSRSPLAAIAETAKSVSNPGTGKFCFNILFNFPVLSSLAPIIMLG